MEKSLITKLNNTFEKNANKKEGIEFWYARDLQNLLDYSEWRNFLRVIEKAKIACIKSKQLSKNHFVDINKMVSIGSDTKREVGDFMLTRYACYLVAQNADPKKEVVAFAQSYFAIQTRKQELLEERIKLAERLTARAKLIATETELSKKIYEREVSEDGFARIRSKGDSALFGGFNTSQMKEKFEIPKRRPLADFLPTVTIKAKDLAAEITNFNVDKENLIGENNISHEHVRNNVAVRDVLKKRGIVPEEIPPEEDIKKLEKRVSRDAQEELIK